MSFLHYNSLWLRFCGFFVSVNIFVGAKTQFLNVMQKCGTFMCALLFVFKVSSRVCMLFVCVLARLYLVPNLH